MAQIVINPEEVAAVSSQFMTKRGEMDAVVNQAKSMMTNLSGQWKGQRSNKTFAEWSSLQPNLVAAIATLERASLVLKAAAADFSAADSV
jgi:WXG100 family type VII secretion target